MRYLMKLRHKKGFTLTELIVVCAIIGILMASLAAFSGPVRIMIKGVDAKSECLTITNTIGNYLEHMLAYADDIKIYAGVNLTAHNSTLDDAFRSMQAKHPGTNDQVRALVFHFEESADPLQNGHHVYELKGKQGVSKKENATGFPTALAKSDCLYYEDFYGSYSFFLGVNNGGERNPTRQKYYLKFDVRSYNFNGGDKDEHGNDRHISAGDCASYYKHLYASATADKMEDYIGSKSAFEKVFFPLENIKFKDSVSFGAFYQLGATPSGGTTPTFGDDVVIIYNIKKASYKSS